jgi:hypothetical protein
MIPLLMRTSSGEPIKGVDRLLTPSGLVKAGIASPCNVFPVVVVMMTARTGQDIFKAIATRRVENQKPVGLLPGTNLHSEASA